MPNKLSDRQVAQLDEMSKWSLPKMQFVTFIVPEDGDGSIRSLLLLTRLEDGQDFFQCICTDEIIPRETFDLVAAKLSICATSLALKLRRYKNREGEYLDWDDKKGGEKL